MPASDRSSEIRDRLGKTLALLRKVTHVSQGALGDALSLHQTAISRIEKGTQLLSPEELYLAAEFFGLKVDALLEGLIDYWRVAERFGQKLPFPDRYTQLPYTRLREAMPFLLFLEEERGEAFKDRFLRDFDLSPELLMSPDQMMGTICHTEILRAMIRSRVLSTKSVSAVADLSRTRRVQGFLHPLYESHEAPLGLVQSWILNAHHYESNFKYRIEQMGEHELTISSAPGEHMKQVVYRDEEMGSLLCDFRKSFLADLPRYIGAKSLELKEHQCHFDGHSHCVYKIRAA